MSKTWINVYILKINDPGSTSKLKYDFRLEENVSRVMGQNAIANSLGKHQLELSTCTWSGSAP